MEWGEVLRLCDHVKMCIFAVQPSRKDRLSLSPPVERTIVLDIPSDQSAASPAADEEKRKKKGGFLNKGRSILKKFTR